MQQGGLGGGDVRMGARGGSEKGAAEGRHLEFNTVFTVDTPYCAPLTGTQDCFSTALALPVFAPLTEHTDYPSLHTAQRSPTFWALRTAASSHCPTKPHSLGTQHCQVLITALLSPTGHSALPQPYRFTLTWNAGLLNTDHGHDCGEQRRRAACIACSASPARLQRGIVGPL